MRPLALCCVVALAVTACSKGEEGRSRFLRQFKVDELVRRAADRADVDPPSVSSGTQGGTKHQARKHHHWHHEYVFSVSRVEWQRLMRELHKSLRADIEKHMDVLGEGRTGDDAVSHADLRDFNFTYGDAHYFGCVDVISTYHDDRLVLFLSVHESEL